MTLRGGPDAIDSGPDWCRTAFGVLCLFAISAISGTPDGVRDTCSQPLLLVLLRN